MMSLYDHLDYRDYLNAWVESHSKGGHGLRKKIADHLNCQGAFVSQVLHKTAHFSMEHGFKLNTFLGHDEEEADYFVLLLLYQRSGNEESRTYFRKKIEAVHKSRLVLKNRIGADSTLTLEERTRYYSAWYYGAIRLLVMIPGIQTRDAIASRLKLPTRTVSSALEFLLKTGLLTEKEGKYSPSGKHIHLGNDSPLISKHHTNWRLQALNAMSAEKENDLHYSVAVTLSREDVVKIKSKIVEFVAELRTIVDPSPSETLCSLGLDWFEL